MDDVLSRTGLRLINELRNEGFEDGLTLEMITDWRDIDAIERDLMIQRGQYQGFLISLQRPLVEAFKAVTLQEAVVMLQDEKRRTCGPVMTDDRIKDAMFCLHAIVLQAAKLADQFRLAEAEAPAANERSPS